MLYYRCIFEYRVLTCQFQAPTRGLTMENKVEIFDCNPMVPFYELTRTQVNGINQYRH